VELMGWGQGVWRVEWWASGRWVGGSRLGGMHRNPPWVQAHSHLVSDSCQRANSSVGEPV